MVERSSILVVGYVTPLSVALVFKNVNENLAGDLIKGRPADRSVPDSQGDHQGNIHNDCWVSLTPFYYHSGTISINLSGAGFNWRGPIVSSIGCEFLYLFVPISRRKKK